MIWLSSFAGMQPLAWKVPHHGESSCGVRGDSLRNPVRSKLRIQDCARYDTTYTFPCMPGDSMWADVVAPSGHVYIATLWLENDIGRCCGFLSHAFAIQAEAGPPPPPPPPPPDTTGVGIPAKYFFGVTRAGSPFMQRNEGPIDWSWGLAPPSPEGPANGDQWSYEAVGTITIPTAGLWTFHVKADDGVQMIVAGTMGINKWGIQPLTEWTYTANLTAGPKQFGLYYMAGIGNSELHLSISGPGFPKQLVPRSWLR